MQWNLRAIGYTGLGIWERDHRWRFYVPGAVVNKEVGADLQVCGHCSLLALKEPCLWILSPLRTPALCQLGWACDALTVATCWKVTDSTSCSSDKLLPLRHIMCEIQGLFCWETMRKEAPGCYGGGAELRRQCD